MTPLDTSAHSMFIHVFGMLDARQHAVSCNRVPSTSESRFLQSAKAYAKVGACFTGYTRYGSANDGLVYCRHDSQWRQQKHQYFVDTGATCFWRALAFVAGRAELDALEDFVQYNTISGCGTGVSIVDAIQLFAVVGMNLGIWEVDIVTGAVGQVIPTLGPPSLGIVYVAFNDKGEFAPHWLPVTNFRLNRATGLTYSDYTVGLHDWMQVTPRGLVAAAAPGLRLFAANHSLVFPPAAPFIGPLLPPPRVVAVPPPPVVPPPPPPPPSYFPPNIDGIVTLRDPPLPAASLGVELLQAVEPQWLSIRKIWPKSSQTSLGDCRLMTGDGPDALDRAFSHGTGCGYLFELRPECLIGQEISEKDFTFVEESGPSPLANGLNCYGQYHLHSVSGIATNAGNWQLVRRGMCLLGQRKIVFHQFCKRAHSGFVGKLWSALPLRTEKIIAVHCRMQVYIEPSLGDFPTADAWYRAMYQFLAAVVPPEVVAPLMTARNEEMALQTRSGKNPREVAESLIQMWRSLCEQFGTAQAFTFA